MIDSLVSIDEIDRWVVKNTPGKMAFLQKVMHSFLEESVGEKDEIQADSIQELIIRIKEATEIMNVAPWAINLRGLDYGLVYKYGLTDVVGYSFIHKNEKFLQSFFTQMQKYCEELVAFRITYLSGEGAETPSTLETDTPHEGKAVPPTTDIPYEDYISLESTDLVASDTVIVNIDFYYDYVDQGIVVGVVEEFLKILMLLVPAWINIWPRFNPLLKVLVERSSTDAISTLPTNCTLTLTPTISLAGMADLFLGAEYTDLLGAYSSVIVTRASDINETDLFQRCLLVVDEFGGFKKVKKIWIASTLIRGDIETISIEAGVDDDLGMDSLEVTDLTRDAEGLLAPNWNRVDTIGILLEVREV